uniref:Sphingomyelin synthase-like domain-containing protein n=1 Tax=Strigamia maritima TaxID=126957 RepID=T1IS64_STRMM
MVFDAMHSNGVLRNHLSSIHLPAPNGNISNAGHSPNGLGPSVDVVVDNDSSSSTHLNGSGGGIDSWQRKPLLTHDHNCEQVSQWVYAKDAHSNSQGNFYSEDVVKINVPSPEREEPKFPREKWKTFLAFVFLCCNWMMTTISLAIVHERLPDRTKTSPLPDIVFDLIQPVDWALVVSEILIIIGTFMCLIILLMHKYRHFF